MSEQEHNENINSPIEDIQEQEVLTKKEKRKKVKTKKKKSDKKKKKGIQIGIGSIMLMLFCSFLLVVATFLQVKVSHFIIPSKFFNGDICTAKDFIFSIKYIPQIPIVMFIVGLLGRRLGVVSILLYIIAGLFFVPVFALGGGWRYIFEYGFGYILAYIPAAIILGTILKKNYSYINVLKAVLISVLTIHLIGICYMTILAYFKHAGINFVTSWIAAQSGIKIIYDLVFSYLLVLVTKYARIILWFYL